jgi:tetratricopeptide (TPR) repeat protein
MAVQRDKVIANAEKLVAKGKIEPAIKEYERLLEDNPNDVNTLNRIGDLWVRINRNDEAVKVFSKIADHYSKDGFFLKAIAIYKKINKLDPSKLEIYAKLADLYAKQGLAMEAKSQYQVLADYYLKHGDPANALAIYRKISELDPNSINVHVKLADLYSQNNRTAEALKEYDRVGRLLLKRGMLDEAVQVFKKALKIDPSNSELVESLVTALLEAKDYDNATGIIETGLENNAADGKLQAMLGRVLLAKGDARGAKAALERGLAANPNDPKLRESVADLHLKSSNPDGALEMLTPLVEAAMGRGERSVAVEMLNRVLRVDSGHAPTLERLVAVYTRLNEETNILASMNSLAEAHVARGAYDRAANVLEKLIQKEPQNAQHRNKLQFVRSQMGGSETIPARAKTASNIPLPRAMEIEETLPSIDNYDDSPSIDLDLDASPPIDLDLGAASAPLYEPPPPAAPPPPQRLVPAVEKAAAELAEGGEDLDFITEHLTEAEVFAKYGLAEKASEHLRAVIERSPKHIGAHEKLLKILLDEGDTENARNLANTIIKLFNERGDDEGVLNLTNDFLSRGISLAPAKAAAPAPAAAPPPPAAPAPPLPAASPAAVTDFGVEEEEELSFDLDAAPVDDFELPSLELEDTSPVPGLSEPELGPIEEMTFQEPEAAFESPSAGIPPLDEMQGFQLEPEPESALFGGLEDDGPTVLDFDAAPPLPAPDEPFFGVEAEGVGFEAESVGFEDTPSAEEIGEVDFYIEQELFDEARQKVSLLVARFPENRDVSKRRDRLDAAVAAASAIAAAAPAPAPPPAPPPAAPLPPLQKAPPPRPEPLMAPPSLSKLDIDTELLSALPDDDDDFGIPEPVAPPKVAAAPPPPPPPPVIEENLFADEDDFFDLAAELETELADDDEPIALAEEEQSLEEIFREFKKGVEQQLDSEDYDTHYNLGIAYKEMGLIDEAIGEFQLASKDPKRAVECASMLGLCFLEKGMPQLAIKWYRKGIEMPEITEDEHVGLLYDLGSAYVEVGDTDNAQKAFMEVYGMNTNYRDIIGRIKQLEDARK